MVEYSYPGVYVTEVSTAPRSIEGVPTSTSEVIGPETIVKVQRLIDHVTPDWTDANLHDPGVTLLEFAAWIVESIFDRAEQVPDRAVLASSRLVLASLALASDRRQPDGSAIQRVSYFEGKLLDAGDLDREQDYVRCLKVVRPRGNRSPLESFRFEVVIDGISRAGFHEAEGLPGCADGPFATLLRRVRKLLGLRKYASIVLKRGVTADRTLADWYRDGSAGETKGHTVMVRRTGPPRREWRLENGWIRKIEAPCLNASGTDIAIESIELVHEGIE